MAELTPEQKKTVAQWIQEGSSLSDVQRRLRDELGVSLTYMDVRLLVIDMGLSVREKTKPAAPAKDAGKTGGPAAASQQGGQWAGDEDGDELPAMDAPGSGSAKVSVSLDRIVKPGALVSGAVTFSDGVSLGWALDQFGRLGLTGGKPGYKPSQQDLMAFQSELRRLLEQKGF